MLEVGISLRYVFLSLSQEYHSDAQPCNIFSYSETFSVKKGAVHWEHGCAGEAGRWPIRMRQLLSRVLHCGFFSFVRGRCLIGKYVHVGNSSPVKSLSNYTQCADSLSQKRILAWKLCSRMLPSRYCWSGPQNQIDRNNVKAIYVCFIFSGDMTSHELKRQYTPYDIMGIQDKWMART